MKFCTQCGEQSEINSKFCKACGSGFLIAQEKPPVVSGIRRNGAMLAISAIIALAGLVALVSILREGETNADINGDGVVSIGELKAAMAVLEQPVPGRWEIDVEMLEYDSRYGPAIDELRGLDTCRDWLRLAEISPTRMTAEEFDLSPAMLANGDSVEVGRAITDGNVFDWAVTLTDNDRRRVRRSEIRQSGEMSRDHIEIEMAITYSMDFNDPAEADVDSKIRFRITGQRLGDCA